MYTATEQPQSLGEMETRAYLEQSGFSPLKVASEAILPTGPLFYVLDGRIRDPKHYQGAKRVPTVARIEHPHSLVACKSLGRLSQSGLVVYYSVNPQTKEISVEKVSNVRDERRRMVTLANLYSTSEDSARLFPIPTRTH